MTKRSLARAEFLSGLLITAIEHRGYGFPGIVTYSPEPNGDPFGTCAVIFDRYENDKQTWAIDIDTMARGLAVARKLTKRPEGVAGWVRDLLTADRTNGDDGDVDVLGALLVLECAIFGEPTYS